MLAFRLIRFKYKLHLKAILSLGTKPTLLYEIRPSRPSKTDFEDTDTSSNEYDGSTVEQQACRRDEERRNKGKATEGGDYVPSRG